MKHAQTLRAIATVALLTLGGSLAGAQTVEFKFNPGLKGREAKLARQAAAQYGTITQANEAGVLHIAATTDADAARIASGLRENRGVLWAQPVAKELPADVAKLPGNYHHRMLAISLKNGQDAAATVNRLAASSGQKLVLRRVATGNRALVVLPLGTTAATLASTLVAAQADSAVASAERVRLMKHQWVPSDPLWGQQWSLGNGVGGIRAGLAWDITPSGSVTVGVIDTGIRSHPDLDGKYVSGYDMISNDFVAVDGDRRDSDPADPGDADIDLDCSSPLGAYSSWHGTHVAGIIAASAQNTEGIAGVAPNARVQSIRALGRCGGTAIDVADSIRWAAGVPVPGTVTNPNPVKVMNLSLGGSGPCAADEQAAVDAAIARGVAVVVAAGNDATFASQFTPANCRGVIAVAASSLLGDLSSYSNYGPEVAISAPGGDFGDLPGVLSTLNGGGTAPSVPSYAAYSGTSMAAPHVAGVIALMLARDPSLTPGQILNRLKSTARTFPAGADCFGLTDVCGAGLLDAANAVASVAINRGVNEVSGNRDRVHLVELVSSVNGRYILSADPVEIDRLAKSGWTRTGQVISTYSHTSIAGAGTAVPQPVCRAKLLGGHEAWSYSANAGECKEYASRSWMQADGMVFTAALPSGGVCASGSTIVWEMVRQEQPSGLYNTRTVANPTVIADMLAANVGWDYNRIAFCAPI